VFNIQSINIVDKNTIKETKGLYQAPSAQFVTVAGNERALRFDNGNVKPVVFSLGPRGEGWG
jgi:hypothetical protein